jgi:phosphate/sulfate permease
VAAFTIGLADVVHMPVSTTQVLSSGVAGTMWANQSGLQGETVRKIGLAWLMTMPASIVLAAGLFTLGGKLVPSPVVSPQPAAAVVSALNPSDVP